VIAVLVESEKDPTRLGKVPETETVWHGTLASTIEGRVYVTVEHSCTV